MQIKVKVLNVFSMPRPHVLDSSVYVQEEQGRRAIPMKLLLEDFYRLRAMRHKIKNMALDEITSKKRLKENTNIFKILLHIADPKPYDKAAMNVEDEYEIVIGSM